MVEAIGIPMLYRHFHDILFQPAAPSDHEMNRGQKDRDILSDPVVKIYAHKYISFQFIQLYVFLVKSKHNIPLELETDWVYSRLYVLHLA